MTLEPAEPLRLDYPIRAGTVHSMTGEIYRSVGLRGPEIVAVPAEPEGLDDLAGPDTIVTDAPDLTLLPAFADSHEHLMEASRNTLLVPVDKARSVAEFAGMISAAAASAASASWILTSMGWHESNLAENRLPTLAELDAAAGQVHLRLDGLLTIEVDRRPAAEADPGAIFDPALRSPESRQRVTVRVRTPCRLAVLARDQLDSQALLGMAGQQAGRLSRAE